MNSRIILRVRPLNGIAALFQDKRICLNRRIMSVSSKYVIELICSYRKKTYLYVYPVRWRRWSAATVIRSWSLKRIRFCIMIKWLAVFNLQSVELWRSVFFSICLTRCQRVAKKIDIIVCIVSRVSKRENKNECWQSALKKFNDDLMFIKWRRRRIWYFINAWCRQSAIDILSTEIVVIF